MEERVEMSLLSYTEMVEELVEARERETAMLNHLENLKPEILKNDLYKWYLKENEYRNAADLNKNFPFSKPLVWYLYNGYTKQEILNFLAIERKKMIEEAAKNVEVAANES